MSSTPRLGGIRTHNVSDDRGTDCIGSYKSNYHTITTTTAPSNLRVYTPVIGKIRSYLCLSCCTKLSCVIKLVTTINICIQWMKTIFFFQICIWRPQQYLTGQPCHQMLQVTHHTLLLTGQPCHQMLQDTRPTLRHLQVSILSNQIMYSKTCLSQTRFCVQNRQVFGLYRLN